MAAPRKRGIKGPVKGTPSPAEEERDPRGPLHGVTFANFLAMPKPSTCKVCALPPEDRDLIETYLAAVKAGATHQSRPEVIRWMKSNKRGLGLTEANLGKHTRVCLGITLTPHGAVRGR